MLQFDVNQKSQNLECNDCSLATFPSGVDVINFLLKEGAEEFVISNGCPKERNHVCVDLDFRDNASEE